MRSVGGAWPTVDIPDFAAAVNKDVVMAGLDAAILRHLQTDTRVKPVHDGLYAASALTISAVERTSDTRGSVFSIAKRCRSSPMLLQASSAMITV